jgi:PAS domain S-box-containing protein
MSQSELVDIVSSVNGRVVVNALLQVTPSIAVIADGDGRILRVSRHACDLSGLSAEEMEGLSLEEFFALVEPRAPDGRRLTAEQFPLARALKGQVQLGREGSFRDRHGDRIPIVSNVAPIWSPSGQVIGVISSVTDLRTFRALEAELRAAVAEKEMLYRELTHRVKNHLQMVSSLVAHEARHDSSNTEELAERVSTRLQMLAAIYDSMNEVKTGGRIYASPFFRQTVQPYMSDDVEVAVAVEPEDATLAPDHAGLIGMLVNEAVCNSYKHAFPERRGRIAVALRQIAPDRISLEIDDNGVGFPPAVASPGSHGVRLMRLLARQLGGELTISAGAGCGARVAAQLPIAIAWSDHPRD